MMARNAGAPLAASSDSCRKRASPRIENSGSEGLADEPRRTPSPRRFGSKLGTEMDII